MPTCAVLILQFTLAVACTLDNRQNAYKKQLEYLFWIWDPELSGGHTEPARVLEEGFMSASTYQVRVSRDLRTLRGLAFFKS